MSAWTEDQLRRVVTARELQIAAVRRNGTLRARTTIWTVRAGDDLSSDLLDEVDEAYREKYGRHSSIVDGITNDQARATTLRLVAREAG